MVGVLVGLAAFAPLLLALVPVLRRKREANMTIGLVGVIASFAVLLLGVIVVYLLVRPVLVAFVAGELIGFFVCWIAIAMAIIVWHD